MAGTDDRIVRMKFDNAQFKKAAGETQSQLSQMDKAVANAGNGKGLLNLSNNMETVRVKAGFMQVAVVTAIANITNKIVDAGLRMGKSLFLDPISQGFDEYELKMKSIQTILANTDGENLKSVTKVLNELNKYSDKTIYNFGNMTDAIGKMTTAGIDLETATATVKGFHNMVALAGGDSQAAAGALEQFNQGLQTGVIKLIDWKSLQTRGLGSQALQESFFQTAKAMGTIKDLPVNATFESWKNSVGGFNASLESGWLTADVATASYKIMTGDIKNVDELMKQGFSRKAAEDMLATAKDAVESATKVRTFTAFMSTLKEQIGSGWSQVFEQLFGDFNEATKLFTKLSDFTGKTIGNIFGYIETVLRGFNRLGGRTNVIKTIRNLLSPIGAILGVIADAWGKAFPSKEAGKGLAGIADGLRILTRPLHILSKIIDGSLSPMEGFFRILGVGRKVLGGFGDFVFGIVKKLAGLVGLKIPTDSGIIGWLKDLMEQLDKAFEKVQKMIEKGKSLKDALGKVKFDVPDLPDIPDLPGLPGLGGGGASLPTGKFGLMSEGIKGLAGSVGLLKDADADLSTGFMFNPAATLDTSRVSDASDQISAAGAEVETVGDKMGGTMETLKDKFMGFIEGFSFDDLMASFNLAVLSTFIISISRMMNTMSKSFEGFVGTGEAVNGILESAGGALKSFQTQARAKLILNIAIALGILAVSLWILSRIPADKLAASLGAVGAIAFIMSKALGSMSSTIEKLDGKGMNLKMLTLGATMVLFSISILILAAAMKKMNDVDWGSLIKAGVAIYALMKAMEKLAEIQKDKLLGAAFAMVVVAGALLLFAVAIKKFAGLDLKTFAEGLVYAAASMAVMTTFLHKFESSVGGALAMVIVVGALYLLVDVIKKFAKLDWQTFGKGMLFVAISLGVLAVAMYGFVSSLAGAAALLVAVGALYAMVGVIALFAELDWSTFGKGMLMITIAFVTLGALMALMGVFSPLILLGAAALLIFGAALFLMGAGILFLAKGLGALILIAGGVVAAITAFATGLAIGFGVFLQTLALQAPIMKDSFLKILQTLIDTIVAAVPMIIDGIKRLWAAVMKELGGGENQGPKQALMKDTGKSWMQKLVDGVKERIPFIVNAAVDLFKRFMNALTKRTPELVQKGVNFVVALLDGLGKNAARLSEAGLDLIIKLVQGLEKNIFKLVNAGIALIATFLHDLASAIRNGSAAIGGGLTDVLDAMRDVGVDMVKGLIGGIGDMFNDAMGAIGDLASGMVNKAKGILDIFSPSRVFRNIGRFLVEGLTQGIQDNAASAIVAVGSMVSGQIAIATQYVDEFIQKLDQKSIEAFAKAAGLQKEAQIAAEEADEAAKKAEKTKKNKKDDKRAKQMQKDAEKLQARADKADKKAERADERVQEATDRRLRAEEFADATLLEKADMRSEDAQNQLDAAKQAELNAASKRAEAQALREAAKGPGVSKKEAKEMREQAEKLERQAKRQAEIANEQIALARGSARSALELQQQAGAEAAAIFQAQFDAEAQEDAETAAFNKLSDADKAVSRRATAAQLQAKANADLARAKELAYTDLEAANELAQQAMEEAEQARQFLIEAEQLELSARSGLNTQASQGGGTIVNLDTTEAASIAFRNYASLYDSGMAAAAGKSTVEFNQYNTSPEALNPTDVYRLTNNQLAYAQGKLQPAA